MKQRPGFGLSQEDPLRILKVLDPGEREGILCVASGGDVPLSLMTLSPRHIVAVDTSAIQLFLTRFKMAASHSLTGPDAALLTGLRKCRAGLREKLFYKLYLSNADRQFWKNNMSLVRTGPVRAGKFEKYLGLFSPLACSIIGKKNLDHLLSAGSIEEQQQIFDQFIAPRKALHALFRFVFHPSIYGKGGIAPEALRYHGDRNPGDYFYRNFREFCTSTPASANYFLQFFLLGECITDNALPEYLNPAGIMTGNSQLLTLQEISMNRFLATTPKGSLRNIHLSNICDWMPENETTELFNLLYDACAPGARICYHYIHQAPAPSLLVHRFSAVNASDILPSAPNRYPFSELLLLRRL